MSLLSPNSETDSLTSQDSSDVSSEIKPNESDNDLIDTIPTTSTDAMTKTIIEQLGKIEENIRHKNRLLNKLKQVQEDISFILSETTKLTASGEPLKKANDLLQINALVGNIFELMDKKSNDDIDSDIDNMMRNLTYIRTRIGAMNMVDGQPASSAPSGPSASSASSAPSAPSGQPKPQNPPTQPAVQTAAQPVDITYDTIDQLRGKSFKIKGKSDLTIDNRIIDFIKNYRTYNSTDFSTIPDDVKHILPQEFIDPNDPNQLSLLINNNKLSFKYRDNTLTVGSNIYHIFSNASKSYDIKQSFIFVVVNNLYFCVRPQQLDKFTLTIPHENVYVSISKINPSDSTELPTKKQLGGKKHTKKRIRKYKKKTHKVKFL